MRRCGSQGLLPFRRRDPSTALGVTAFAVLSSGGPLARSRDISTGRNIHPCGPQRLLPIHPRDPSTALGVTAFAVMLSGGATSPEVETSRLDGASTIATRTGSRPSDRRDSSTTPAASLGMTALCHLERSDSEVERSRPIGAFTLTTHPRSAPNRPAETLGKTGVTTFCKKKSFYYCI